MNATAKLVSLSAALSCAILLAPTHAWAINKCIGPDGKVSFQEQPCPGKGGAIEVKPASGHAPAPAQATPAAPSAAPTATAPAAPTGKKEGVFGASYRRKLDLESHLISNSRAELSNLLQSCDAHQRSLAAKKGHAKNNLAGATWEQSISAEMQAAAATCDTKARDIRARLEGYEKELRELQAVK